MIKVCSPVFSMLRVPHRWTTTPKAMKKIHQSTLTSLCNPESLPISRKIHRYISVMAVCPTELCSLDTVFAYKTILSSMFGSNILSGRTLSHILISSTKSNRKAYPSTTRWSLRIILSQCSPSCSWDQLSGNWLIMALSISFSSQILIKSFNFSSN